MQFDIKTPSPIFGGSTGGWLRSALEEEKYAITWNTPKEQIFEMPTGGAAIMRLAENLVYFARKEQCLALGSQLQHLKLQITKFIESFHQEKFILYTLKMDFFLKK